MTDSGDPERWAAGEPNETRSERDSNPRGGLPTNRISRGARSRTGSVWNCLLNANSTGGPSGSHWFRLPVGIVVGIGPTDNH